MRRALPLNMALSGNGLFVTTSPSGQVAYTRAGNFTPNAAGQLVTANGDYVMGYPATNGVVNTTASLQPLNVGVGATVPASATTSFDITANLNSTAADGNAGDGDDPALRLAGRVSRDDGGLHEDGQQYVDLLGECSHG